MAVRIGSNISSLEAQRRLAESASVLSRTYERLSSGQRINRASDDAAGLAIADSLHVGSKISVQGVRNLNDSVSYYAIAEGAVRELKNIILRGKELAEQSANGVYSNEQRSALNNELQSLGEEYNRILSSTSFNNLKVFEREGNTLVSQAGTSILATTLSSERAKLLDEISCISVARNGTDPNAGTGSQGRMTLSADGRYALFASYADNLLAGMSGGQLYRKDLQTGELKLVSCNSSGEAVSTIDNYQGSLSPDGRYAVFTTDLGVSGNQIFLKDIETGELKLASSNAPGQTLLLVVTGEGPRVTSDGRYVMFSGIESGTGSTQVFLKDLQTEELSIISTNSSGQMGDSSISSFGMSADGRYVVFSSLAENLVGGMSGQQIYRKDLQTGEIVAVSTSATGQATDGVNVDLPCISANGRYVVFLSDSTNLVSGVSGQQIYRKDLQTGQIEVVSSTADGNAGDQLSFASSISADGRYVAFGSRATNLISGADNGLFNTYVKDCETGAIECVNRTQSGRLPTDAWDGEGAGDFVSISADGQYVFFISDYRDQVDGESRDDYNAFVAANSLSDSQYSLARFQWVNIKTQGEARNALSWFDDYLTELNTFQGDLGSSMSRLDVAKNVLSAMSENFRGAESRIRDADIAEETAVLTKTQILQQVASAVLAQANQSPALAIRLLNPP